MTETVLRIGGSRDDCHLDRDGRVAVAVGVHLVLINASEVLVSFQLDKRVWQNAHHSVLSVIKECKLYSIKCDK